MKDRYIIVLLSFYAIAATIMLVFFPGTGDSGDSIHHYLFAKYAPSQPELFFNHWAKPMFVLLASPFAQVGFIGVKVFNTLVFATTIYFTYLIAKKLELKNAIIGAMILVFAPLHFTLTFSGLTEPLFAMFIAASVYAILVNRLLVSCIIISFLPFVRSEGLIIIGIFGLYFLIKKQWKFLPLLLVGHVVYSIAGFPFYDDILWVFTKIPYSKLSSTYGSGELTHFIEKLNYVVGVPIYILFWLGTISIGWQSIKKRCKIEVQVLIFIGFWAFFIAHSLFWYLGIFNSMGLQRVLVGIAPLTSIIALIGFNFISEELLSTKKTARLVLQSLLVGYLIVFPFTSNRAAINWEKEYHYSQDQESAQKVATFIASEYPNTLTYAHVHPYLSEVLNINHFDRSKRVAFSETFIEILNKGDIVIWENWFALVEYNISKEMLQNDERLKNIYESSEIERGREIKYAVYQKQ